jgi:hypothetical protein
MIRRAAGHFITLGIPRLHHIGVLGIQHPIARRGHWICADLINNAGLLGSSRGDHLAFKQEGRGRHGAELAHHPRSATGPGEDADKDFRQANPRLRVIRGKGAMRGQRQLQPDARGGAGDHTGDRLAALVGLRVHARALDLAQQGVHLHRALKKPLGRIVACVFLHLGQKV